METVNPKRINNVCRICFEFKHDTISLFTKKERCTLYDMLLNNTKLSLHAYDGGPTVICTQCFGEFNVFLKFLDKCQRANELFLQNTQNFTVNNVFANDTNICLQNYPDKEKIEVISKKHNNYTQNTTNDANENSLEHVSHKNITKVAMLHTCQFCSKVFTRKFNFKLHLKRHSGERDWRCPQCGAATITRALARRHCVPRARKQCPVTGCGKTFTSVTNLQTHVRKHNGERPYACSECGKTFGSKNTLNDHLRIHTGVKPYMCPTCGKRFTTNKLSVHMRVHCAARGGAARSGAARVGAAREGAARHACSLCSARYSHKQSLNKHLRKRHSVKTS